MRCEGYTELMIGMTNMYKILDGKSEGKKTLGIFRNRRKDTVVVDIKRMGCGQIIPT